MRKMKVKSPEKETATTASEEDQESSLRGVPSAGTGGGVVGSGDGPGRPGGGHGPAWGLWMHPGGGAGGGTAHRLPALLSPQLGARRGRGAHGGGQGRDPMRGTHTVTMTPHAPAWGSQVPPLPSQTPAPAGTDSSPCPARLHQGANTTGQTPAPSPQTPHQPQTTSYGARGCSPRTSRHRNPKSIPPTPRGSARTTSPQLPALGAPAARQLPHYYSAQSLPNNRRIVAGGSKKTPTGSCSGTTERVPVPQGCAITDPKTFLPVAAPCCAQHLAGQGAGLAPPAQLCPRTACPWGGT